MPPRVLTRPPFASEEAGQEAIELAAAVGLVLDPWQELLVKLTLAEGSDGRWAADTVAALVARQNGKGAWLEAVVLHGLFLVRDPLTLWTAHQFKTSTEAFLRIRGWIDGSSDLSRYVRRINAAHGEEGIELTMGPRLRFLARSKSSGRGFSPQRVIFDEAQELAKVAQEAMVPAMRAQRNKQAIYTGTVPGPDVNHPEAFTRLRDRGRAGGSARLAWAEWSPEGSDNAERVRAIMATELDKPKHWKAANPSWGIRVTAEALRSDYESLDPDSFAREALSLWPATAGTDVFGPGLWEACATDKAPPLPRALGLAVSVDRAWASIAAAGMRGKGKRVHVDAVDRRRGTGWLLDEAARIAAEHACPVVVDGNGPAADLADDLEERGVEVITAATADYLDACAMVYDRVQAATLTHGHTTDLDTAVAAATWRMVGDRRAWARKAGDISTLEAATLAAWGALMVRELEPSALFV